VAARGCLPASWSLSRADIRNATVLAVPFRRRRFIPRRRLHSLLALKLTSKKPGTEQHPSVSVKKLLLFRRTTFTPYCCRSSRILQPKSLPSSRSVYPPLLSVRCPVVFASQPLPFRTSAVRRSRSPRTTSTPYSCRFALLRLTQRFAILQKRLSPAAPRSMPGGVCILALLVFRTSAVRFPSFPLFPSSHPCQPQL